jgi:hypothetical protein
MADVPYKWVGYVVGYNQTNSNLPVGEAAVLSLFIANCYSIVMDQS